MQPTHNFDFARLAAKRTNFPTKSKTIFGSRRSKRDLEACDGENADRATERAVKFMKLLEKRKWKQQGFMIGASTSSFPPMPEDCFALPLPSLMRTETPTDAIPLPLDGEIVELPMPTLRKQSNSPEDIMERLRGSPSSSEEESLGDSCREIEEEF
eukprot:CAMPEP_0194066066 /NCGR_PEP_ID=MMETSP0009_2-20130614/85817_1 /TAXON_ID=210454 /ORGANISM="Grammatophora oceanica, Strain CCMP 410" /LENGTH=155 /DNA_ID=CAMNT_0038718981 /DNA_START=74 /DNA_END=541 /DNA_ORIENTATION=+